MIARTVKGPVFTIIVDGKEIVVQHVCAKGRRCRVTAPNGVRILNGHLTNDQTDRGATPQSDQTPTDDSSSIENDAD